MKLFLKLYIITCLLIMGSMFFVTPQANSATDITFTPQVPFNDFPAQKVTNNTLGLYIIAITKYATGIVGILATVILMFGGVRWLAAGGSPTAVSDAKAWIGASLMGLALSLCSFLLLSTINPALTSFKPLDIKPVTPAPTTAAQTANSEEQSLCTGYYEGAQFSGTILYGAGANETNCQNACGGSDKTAISRQMNTQSGWCCVCKSGISPKVSNCNNVTNGTECQGTETIYKYLCYDNKCKREGAFGGSMDGCGPAGSNAKCFQKDSVLWGNSTIFGVCPSGYTWTSGGNNCIVGYLCCRKAE